VARVEPISGDATGPILRGPRAVPLDVVVRREACIQRLSLWSVAKLALAFWTCIGVLMVSATLLAWQMLRAMGVVGNTEGFVADLTSEKHFHFVPGQLMLAALLVTSAFVLAMTTLTLVGASFYNLLSRIMGGIEVELSVTDDSRTS
jgi:small neutral amino acid transporter SnatA (MarC family)